MENSNIINNIVTTDITNSNVRRTIPVLVRWAKQGAYTQTYGDLCAQIGYKDIKGAGRLAGSILKQVQLVLDELSNITGESIPTLNSLCKNKGSMLPSEGFSFVSPDYQTMDAPSQRLFVKGLDLEAHNYSKWDWVLKELGLKELSPITEEELSFLSMSSFGGGEGEEHKTLKEYILHNPHAIGIHKVIKAETEYILPSGDRLDIYFELENGNRVAVEIKPSTSPENDINRGIFQCIKYNAVLNAIKTLKCDKFNVRSVLVTSKGFSELNTRLAKELQIEYIENFEF